MKIRGGVADHKGDNNSLMSSHKNHQHQHFSGEIVKIVLLFLVICLTCIVLNQSNHLTQLVISHSFSSSSSSSSIDKDNNLVSGWSGSKSEDLTSHINDGNNLELESILKRAAIKDSKTVIITTLNAAWTEPNSIFDLFLESFRIGNQTQSLLKHLVVVALDKKAYSRCLDVHSHCFALTSPDDDVDFSGLAFFMSSAYLKMMWRRIDFLRSVLVMGYSFVFSDADIMWLRDPFPRFYPDADFQIACDLYKYNSTNLHNYPNGGFTFVESNERTIQFYKFWHAAKDYFPGKHDQDVFQKIKFDPFLQRIGLRIRFLDTAYFGGFCEPSKDLGVVVTMHANCCVGLGNKIHDIRMVIDDWKRYMALAHVDESSSRTMSWTVPRRCGLKKRNSTR